MFFSDRTLEKILIRQDVSAVPCEYRATMIRAISDVMEEETGKGGGSHGYVSEPESL